MKTQQNQKPEYYVLDATRSDRMLLFDIPDPSFEDSWFCGRPFEAKPKEPISVKIRPGNERSELLPYFGTPPVMSDAFYETLRAAGVYNLEVFDAVIQSKDGTIAHHDYKAFNIVGLVRGADLSRTRFSANNPSRNIDASIESLTIDPDMVQGLLMFCLAEYVGAVLVHEKVKAAIEAEDKFPHIMFVSSSAFVR